MLKTVYIIENSLEPFDAKEYKTDDVLEFLTTLYDKWPDTAHIYHEFVSQSTDVTPSDEGGIEKLATLEGNFYCVIYPADAITILYAIVAVAIVAAVLLRPAVPTVSQRNTQSNSPNNELSSRVNKARPNGRIPDIFGQVRSTPDLISLPYTTYVGNQEVENCVMCIGRGAYEIYDMYDGETPWSAVAGSSVQVYEPNTDVNTDLPYFQIGTSINDRVWNVARSNSINGQVLRPPNNATIVGNNDIYFQAPNKIITNGERKFTDSFIAGDSLTLSNASIYKDYTKFNVNVAIINSTKMRFMKPYPVTLVAGSIINVLSGIVKRTTVFSQSEDSPISVLTDAFVLNGEYMVQSVVDAASYTEITLVNPSAINVQWVSVGTTNDTDVSEFTVDVSQGVSLYNLNGVYSVLAVSDTVITLSNPSAINPQWTTLPAEAATPSSPTLGTNGFKTIGPFLVENIDGGMLSANLIAANGLYKDNGESQYSATVHVVLQYTPIYEDGSTGPLVSGDIFMIGSSVNKETRASTLQVPTPFKGAAYVQFVRLNPSDTAFTGTVVDEVKIKDLFRLSNVPNGNFGNVTILKSQSYATAGALALKERKLNCLVTRKIRQYTGNGTFSADLRPLPYAPQIIYHLCLDEKIGNRQISEIDFEGIFAACDAGPKEYFGTQDAIRFDYTFDKDNLSFEETIQMVAHAVFCLAYRQGNVIKLSFERETEDSTLLFNHRNKLPGSEVRTATFGSINDNDGIELEYVSPLDDAVITYYLPEDRTAVNPKKIETVGIRNFYQAYFTANRAWNKIRYQNLNTEFDATHEADLSIPSDRILVADNTRPNTQDGEIISQVGLTLYTSQKLKFENSISYIAFLQLSDGTVQPIPAIAGPVPASMVLMDAPRLPLAVESGLYARTTYILAGNNDVRQRAFLVTEKITQENMTSKIRAANYDARFYEHDKDLINGII